MVQPPPPRRRQVEAQRGLVVREAIALPVAVAVAVAVDLPVQQDEVSRWVCGESVWRRSERRLQALCNGARGMDKSDGKGICSVSYWMLYRSVWSYAESQDSY